jgi:hypothetical protein
MIAVRRSKKDGGKQGFEIADGVLAGADQKDGASDGIAVTQKSWVNTDNRGFAG